MVKAEFKAVLRFPAIGDSGVEPTWYPHLSWLQYDVPGDEGPENRIAVTVDIRSLWTLLSDHGFLHSDQPPGEDDAERAMRVIKALLHFTDREYRLTGPTPDEPDRPLTLNMLALEGPMVGDAQELT